MSLHSPDKPAARLLDTFHEVETPEGVEFQLPVAGLVVRSLAWGTDTLIRFGIYILLGISLPKIGNVGIGVMLILLFLIEWFYPVLFEIYRHGATPGKRWLGLCVVNDDGTPVGWSGSMVRNLLRFVDFLPFFYGAGLVSMLVSTDSKRLGDLAAGTRVVYRKRASQAAAVRDEKAIPPVVPLQIDEQRAVVDFAGRLDQLSKERSQELAAIVAPLVTRANGSSAVSLVGIANWLLGR